MCITQNVCRNKIRIRLFVLYDEYIRITTNLYRYYYEVRTLKELKLIIDLKMPIYLSLSPYLVLYLKWILVLSA